MKHSYKIVHAEHDPPRERILLTIDLLEGTKRIEQRHLAYPASLSDKELEQRLARYTATFFDDRRLAEESKKRAQEDMKTRKRMEDLIGKQKII